MWKVRTWKLNRPRYGALAWKVQPWTSNHPRYQPSAWMVQHMDPALSATRGTNVEGSALDIEPSTISTFSVEGSTHEPRTVREMGHQHGRLGLGEWNRPRYGALTWKVQPWILNCPRYRPPAWMVQHMDVAPSMIQALSVEGPALDIEPSAILAPTEEGSRQDTEPSTIWGISMDG